MATAVYHRELFCHDHHIGYLCYDVVLCDLSSVLLLKSEYELSTFLYGHVSLRRLAHKSNGLFVDLCSFHFICLNVRVM